MRLNSLAFAAGVLLLQIQPALPEWPHCFALGVVSALSSLLLRRWPCRPPVAVAWLLACFLFGFSWATWRAEQRLEIQLPVVLEGVDIRIAGVVAGLPQEFGHGTRFEFDVEPASTATGPLPGRVMLSWYRGRHQDEMSEPLVVRPGERWQFQVRLKRPHGNANPGGFDYEAWLLERQIRATGYVRPVPPERLSGMVWQAAYVIERLRYQVRERFNRMLPVENYPWAGVLMALAIGDQRAIDTDLWAQFNRTGITHLVSISGLHVTMVAALFGGLVGWSWRRVPTLALRLPAQKAAIVAGVLAAFLYTLMAGFGVPAQRTLYMLLVVATAMLSGRLVSASRILCLALLVVVILDPWSVRTPGFWLSFGAVGALLYIGAALAGEGRGWLQRLQTWGAIQWAATLASIPVLLLVFQQFSLVSPLANALAIPVVSFIVTPLALLAALIPWWPILALAHGVFDALMFFIGQLANWPMWLAPAPPLWAVMLAAGGVFVGLLPRGVPGRLLGFALLLPALFWPVDRPAEGTARITVLDVGQGLASVVQTRNHLLIYDPGPLYSAESDAGQRVVVPFLRFLGISQVDMLVVTHRDSDHSGGTESVLTALAVRELRSSMAGIGAEPCLAGQSWQWDGVKFEVLHPTVADVTVDGKANHVSCVLRVEAGGKSMLLTSDIEARDEAALLARLGGRLAADVLLVPHHGSRTSSTPAFLAAVAAPVAIIPVGHRNRFGHPRADVLARYAANGSQVWRTDRDGALTVHLGTPAVRIESWRSQYQRYWHRR
jgi:competence protein ComEC